MVKIKNKSLVQGIKKAVAKNRKKGLSYNLYHNHWIECLICYNEWISYTIRTKSFKNTINSNINWYDFIKIDSELVTFGDCPFFRLREVFEDREDNEYFFWSFNFDIYKICDKVGVVIPQERELGKYGRYHEWE